MKKINSRQKNNLVSWLLRVGLATVLLYAGLASLASPDNWVGYLPHFLTSHISGLRLLRFFSVYEILLALWLLSGLYLRFAACLAAATFAGIILTNLTSFIITFRDIPMICAALALLFLDAT